MKIGIMSDTHDRLDAVERAIKLFNSMEVEHVLHAGDIVSPFVVPRLARLRARLTVVWGNNDGDRLLLSRRMAEHGIEPAGELAVLTLAGRRLALLHGTSEHIVRALAASGEFDAVVRGHTHEASITRTPCLVINPGEVCGYLTGRMTVAVLDLASMEAEIVEL